MINTVWQGFPRFHVAFVIKKLLYIEFSVFRKKKKGWKCRKCQEQATACLGRDTGIPIATEGYCMFM